MLWDESLQYRPCYKLLSNILEGRAQSHAFTSVRTLKIPARGRRQGLVDDGNTKTPMHPRLGSATLSQLAFNGEGNPNFSYGRNPIGTIQL